MFQFLKSYVVSNILLDSALETTIHKETENSVVVGLKSLGFQLYT